MKHLLVLACLLSANIQLLPAQDSLPQKPVFRIAKIKTLNAQTSTGYLYAIADSALLLSIQKEPIRFYDNPILEYNHSNTKTWRKPRSTKRDSYGVHH